MCVHKSGGKFPKRKQKRVQAGDDWWKIMDLNEETRHTAIAFICEGGGEWRNVEVIY